MKFKVVGNHPVAGVAPGGTVDLDHLPQVNVDALLASGHIEKPKPKKTKSDDEDGD